MTAPGSPVGESSFVSKKLPWLIGAAATLLYFATLAHWITPGSLENIANISGWNEHYETTRPLSASAFLVFRILPESWIPLAANFFASLCAALCLVLLAQDGAVSLWQIVGKRLGKCTQRRTVRDLD